MDDDLNPIEDQDTVDKPQKTIKENICQQSKWIRALYMALFIAIACIVKMVLAVVILFQFILVLVTNETNQRVLQLGRNLSIYWYQILLYLTYNSDSRPYPFSPWPDDDEGSDQIL